MRSLKSTITFYSKLRWTLCAATVVAAGAFYGLIYRPQTKQLREVESRIASTSGELAICQDQTRMLNTVATDVERLRSRLREFKTLPKQQDLSQFIRDIAELGIQANLHRFEQRQAIPVRGPKLSAQPMSLTFEGDFVNVFSFLRHTEELQRLIRVPNINIQSVQGPMKDRDGQVKVQMTMNIYFAAE
jgi:Tfp pilus assembly protein PilO